MEQKLQRYGPLGAIAGIILVLVSFAVHGRWASTEESAQEIADLYVQNQDRVFIGSWLAILGALCVLVFGMCMSQRVRDTGQQLLGMLVAGGSRLNSASRTIDSSREHVPRINENHARHMGRFLLANARRHGNPRINDWACSPK